MTGFKIGDIVRAKMGLPGYGFVAKGAIGKILNIVREPGVNCMWHEIDWYGGENSAFGGNGKLGAYEWEIELVEPKPHIRLVNGVWKLEISPNKYTHFAALHFVEAKNAQEGRV